MIKQRNFFKVPELNCDSTISNSRVGIALIICATLALTSCSNRKVITTFDDSAEYKTARALAPLQKSINGVSVDIEEASNITLTQPVTDIEAKEVAIDRAYIDGTVSSRSVKFESSAGAVTQNTGELSESSSASGESPVEAALLIEGNAVKLMLNFGIDEAWVYLTEKLEGSEITVFSRNKSAGRIAIGCAEIGIETEEVLTGRWSIFNRKVSRISEYCSLQAVERKSVIVVSVINRVGQEASADDSRLIFDRILK